MIFLASVQHTGTRFTIGYLEKMTGKQITLTTDALTTNDPIDLFHTHIGVREESLFKGQIVTDLQNEFIYALANTYPTVIPLRDPVLSLITREQLHPALTHEHIVNGFTYVTELAHLENVHFLRVDISNKEDQKRIAKELGYKFPNVANKMVGSSGESQLKRAYLKGEDLDSPTFDCIRMELNLLKSKPQIKEFFISQGYKPRW